MGPMGKVPAFWYEQCPERGAGLDHAHWKDCDPARGHPPDPAFPFQEAVVHQWSQCCHCEHTAETWEQARGEELRADMAMREAGIPAPDVNDHQYVHTVVGLCGRAGCRKPMAMHAPMVRVVPGDECGPHTNVNPIPLIGEAGLEWPTCPNCGVQKEPKLATGDLSGPKYGLGKGYVTERMRRRWEEVAHRLKGIMG